MWFRKKEETNPTIVMICVAQCSHCNAPIYGPASMEVPRDISTENLMRELSAKVVNFCVCNQQGLDEMPTIGGKPWAGTKGN